MSIDSVVLSEDLQLELNRIAQSRSLPAGYVFHMASDDPDFEAKAADFIGLYLSPPQHAAVFCVDEKTAIQALDRLDPVLPLSPAVKRGHTELEQGTSIAPLL